MFIIQSWPVTRVHKECTTLQEDNTTGQAYLPLFSTWCRHDSRAEDTDRPRGISSC